MKTCPVCQAKAFDDAEVCYGCLHRFESEREQSSLSAVQSMHPSTSTVSEPMCPTASAALEPMHSAVPAASEHVCPTGLAAVEPVGSAMPAAAVPACSVVPAAPEFCIRFTPALGTGGQLAWQCKVETQLDHCSA